MDIKGNFAGLYHDDDNYWLWGDFHYLVLAMLWAARATTHSGFKWLKPAENKFVQSDFTSFYMKVSTNLHI